MKAPPAGRKIRAIDSPTTTSQAENDDAMCTRRFLPKAGKTA
jgi:hypothetical protein